MNHIVILVGIYKPVQNRIKANARHVQDKVKRMSGWPTQREVLNLRLVPYRGYVFPIFDVLAPEINK